MRESAKTLATELLKKAQIEDAVDRLQKLEGGMTNETWLVHTLLGNKVVLRVYTSPADEEEMGRIDKEIYLHGLLNKTDVPVPHILSHMGAGDQGALLMTFVEGELLGEVSAELSEEDRDRAWATSGEALRKIHDITIDTHTHGVVVGNKVRPVSDSFGDWQMMNILTQAKSLKECHNQSIDLNALETCLQGALSYLNRQQGILLHNDPHPWNILVNEQQAWQCSAWLDWEYAFVGDPNWDLVRLDIWRVWPLETPMAFWEGYGRQPHEPNRTIYEMSLYLWQANEALGTPNAGPIHTREKAIEYVKDFGNALHHLQSLVR